MSAQNSKPTGVLGAFAGLVGLSALAGVLVTALVTPALAVTGMTAKASIDIFNSLPEYLEINQLATKNTIYGLDVDGVTPVPIAQIYKQNREEVEWDQVSQFIKDAVVAGEDRRFYEHGGVDVASVVRAAVGNLASSDIESGASTLTMQLVKNIRIQSALEEESESLRKAKLAEAQEQTIERKLQEAKLAIGLEKKYTKDEIMLAYLNIAGFGGTTYGVQSAAKQFFSVPASDVTLAQAASLIAIVQTPTSHSLRSEDNFEANKTRRDFILGNMLELGSITQEQYDEAIATPIEVTYSEPQNGCMYATTAWFFCDYVTKLVPELEMLGTTAEERQRNWERGGYSVYTSLQINQQDHAQATIWAQAPAEEQQLELGAVVNVVEPGTGRIRVMAQNKYFNNTEDGGGWPATAVNFSTDRPYGGSSGFQTGSTYKIFTLATWLNAGHGLNEVVNGARRTFEQASFPNSCEEKYVGPWNPPNYGGGSGSTNTTVLQSTISSYNISYIAMAQKLDLCTIRDTAAAFGVHRADDLELQYSPATVLGTNEIAPLTMAAAIAAVGANGLYCKPTAIDNIVDADGNELGGQTRECSQAVSPEVSAAMAYALKRVVQGGTGSGSNPGDGIELAGKTGTTDGSEDTWMVGSTSTNGMAVWVGNINGDVNLTRVTLPGGNGGTARHRIFRPIIAALNAQYGGAPYAAPPSELLSGQGAIVPNVIGQSQEQAKVLIESLGFNYVYGGEVSSEIERGRIAAVEPGPGATVPKGTTITVYGSLQNSVPMPDVIGMTFSAAKRAIGSSFTVVESCQALPEDTDPDSDAIGKVTASDPAENTQILPGATITLAVSRLDCS
ncbi:transglycosylase domain-containing protein [Salinibacterium sp. SYSU T00001]|uniref:transglycosylase domain-containing protein n=1 Tax=Homoserinimonas sedimenticola TaxID=2986805 RepID=UPI002236A7F8|nr:transglycosylase domain-containing protein [Salinibacterium sedimenticola]MCW4385172.1 transglycosylase domain-containing protein [Salinibacterium sedimenticola]